MSWRDRADAAGLPARGKRYVTIAVGCTGGKHRSVAIAEALSPAGQRRRRRDASSCTATWGGSDAAPAVVALGGGHGLSASLAALRLVTDRITAVVTVADDGGSSGRLREELDVLPPGDLRMALAALCDDSEWGHQWRDVLQHRFAGAGTSAATRWATCSSSRCGTCSATPSAGLDWVGRLLGRPGPGAADGGRAAADRGQRARRRPGPAPTRSARCGARCGRVHPGPGARRPAAPGGPAGLPGDRRAPSTPPTGSSSAPAPGSPPCCRTCSSRPCATRSGQPRAQDAHPQPASCTRARPRASRPRTTWRCCAAHAPELRLDVVLADPSVGRGRGRAAQRRSRPRGATLSSRPVAERRRTGPPRLAAPGCGVPRRPRGLGRRGDRTRRAVPAAPQWQDDPHGDDGDRSRTS